ncbi:MAG: RNA polymerase sigma factor [Armatimonadetes bacterium]|nr:RNA polymerase sigma factor [Armatimonadota bacterium]
MRSTGARQGGARESAERRAHELILSRCARADERGLEMLFERWDRPLFYYVRRMLGDEEASDVTQDIWVEISRGVHRVGDAGALPAWLYRVARNVVADHIKKQAGRGTEPLDEAPEPTTDERADPESIAFVAAEAAQVQAAISRLPFNQREAVVLHFLNDLNLAEIGLLLGVPEGTVKSRLFYARRRLREILDGR